MGEPAVDAGVVAVVEAVCGYIRANLDGPLTLAALGRVAGYSPAYLQRVFRRVLGISPKQFTDGCRLEKLKAGLRHGESVTAAMTAAGYGSSSRLYGRAAGDLGMTPRAYQKGGAAVAVRYGTAESTFGRVLLAATDRGVCAVAMADADDTLDAFVRAEFPAALLSKDIGPAAGWLAAVVDHLAGRRPQLELPLDVRATAFQRRVWEELRRIPWGETRTYKQVAAALGDPAAVRAVARACATNPASLVIPCHRVVGTDGGLRGYRWGVDRKRRLLDQEQG